MNYQVRPATIKELNLAIDWAASEGWNPGLHDADAFYNTDPHGYFMGFLDDKPIASLSAVSYGRNFGFLGFYIVKPEYRGKGYGWQLWQAALKYLTTQNIGLDGVLAQQANYQKSGFNLAYRNIRYEGVGASSIKKSHLIIPINTIPLADLLRYDRRMFPVQRREFLQHWITRPESLALGYWENDRLRGYGMVRKCRTGFKVGPLFADNTRVAEELFQQLRKYAGKEKIYLDIPEVNREAVRMAESYEMKPMFETARMYTKKAPDIDLHKIFGVTTFELG